MANDNFEDLFNNLSSVKKTAKTEEKRVSKPAQAFPEITKNKVTDNKKAGTNSTRKTSGSDGSLPLLNKKPSKDSSLRVEKQTAADGKVRNESGSKQVKSNPYAKYINNTSTDTKVTSKEESKVGTDTHIPLSRPGMSEVKVTRDGKTLEEMLPSLRGGGNPIDNKIANIRNKATDVSINNKKVTDDRYTKHQKTIDNDVKKTEARRKLSNKFVQRNARYTEDEKILLRNLGIPMNDLVNTLKKDDLTKGDKMNILKYGSKGLERYYKGKRFRVTHANLETLEFLAKFKFASTRILSLLKGEPQGTTNRRLHRMKKSGLVADYEIPGMGTAWCATEIGMAISGYELPTFRQKRPKMSTMPPVIGINYIAACLWHNKFNVLYADDFPAKNFTRNGSDGKQWKIEGEDLVSELEIRSSYGKELKPKGSEFGELTSVTQDQLIENAHLIWHKWEREGRNPDSPEMYPGNEYLWILYPENSLSVSYHVPDLVIVRPRKSDGTPQSIAIECELSHKSAKNYRNTMQAYKDDKYIYDKVIWVTNNASITRAIQQAAEDVGNTNYDIVPFSNENGIYKNRDIWYI